jgi:hypothetical protein
LEEEIMSDNNQTTEPESVKGCPVANLFNNIVAHEKAFWRRVASCTALRGSCAIRGGKVIDMAAYKNRFAAAFSTPASSDKSEV